jgi:tetratricopeptide (TPR) repeat protein
VGQTAGVPFGTYRRDQIAGAKSRMASRKQSPNRPSATLARASAHWREHRFDEALRYFNQAVREAPNDLSVLIDAARARGARYQIERSEALLAKAARLGSRRADVLHAVGESYRMLGRSKEAETCFRQANLLAASPATELELARLCERRHALAEADELVGRVLKADPRSPSALLLHARLARRRGEFDTALSVLQPLAKVSTLPAKLQAEVYGELSAVLDAAGEFAAAWEAIVECKKRLLTVEQASWEVAQFVLARTRRMLDALTLGHFQRWDSTESVEPPCHLALLTGFPRSGTTLLEQVLAAHPDIVESDEREIFSGEVFPRLGEHHPSDAPIEQVLDALSPTEILDARQLYLRYIQAILGEPIGNRMHVDKNPAMNLMIPAMRRIFPELKLIVALRDPRDVVLSCFLRYLPINPVSVCFLTLERTVDRYRLDMEAWLKMRDMFADWVEVRYERLIADLPGEAERVFSALEVPWDESVLEYRSRKKPTQVRSPSYEEVARPLFTTSIGRWQNYERQLAPVLAALAPLVDAFGYER